ncbi:tetrahydromethanopterin S-methyltransferase subunit C [Kitasatospora sp. MAP12-15]|uniref:DUF6113 family protein n=1 Tax=unclassified Kitasatospora TaxID=2633591 RepID=UPI0024757808|nr:DUF6113 family protein [Kitasatospora sp. MAP12-44]MDH6112636.1 tetrahydromethanopterin S-methyltransferase subunit C [Kitasatospora sp. MAP12-44]
MSTSALSTLRTLLHAPLGTRAQRLAEPLPSRRARITGYLVLFPLGAVVSLCGCFVQTLWSPWGLLLALLANVAVFYGGLRLTGTKLGAGVPLAGWFVMLMVLMAPRPEGDFILAAGFNAYAYLLIGLVSGVICTTLPTRSPFAFGIPKQRD